MEAPEYKRKNGDEEVGNAKRTAALSVWFILIPAYLIFCALMKLYFNVQLQFFDLLDEIYSSLDKSVLGRLTAPTLFIGFPVIGIILNMTSIIEMYFDHNLGKSKMQVKNKPLNILVMLLCLLILGLFAVYWFTKILINK